MRYSNINKLKANGVVYTPTAMANYLAKEMVHYKSNENNIDSIRILDPAVGRGELLIALLNTIKVPCALQIEVVGYETDAIVCEETQKKLSNLFPNIIFSIKNINIF